MHRAPGNKWVGAAWETGFSACSLVVRSLACEEGFAGGIKNTHCFGRTAFPLITEA